jgi:hypothetical protein
MVFARSIGSSCTRAPSPGGGGAVGTLFGQSEHSQLSGLDENTLKALIHTDFGLKVTPRRHRCRRMDGDESIVRRPGLCA